MASTTRPRLAPPTRPSRGELWWVDLEPVRGREQGRKRPALILSVDEINHSGAGIVTVVPVTGTERPLRSRVPILPPDGGVSKASYAICEQIRTIASERVGRRIGRLARRTLADIEQRVRFVLGL